MSLKASRSNSKFFCLVSLPIDIIVLFFEIVLLFISSFFLKLISEILIIGSLKMPLRYPEPSSISSRHPGKISVFGNRVGDIEHCIKEKYLNERDLIMGQWIGSTKTYSECKINPHYSLESCPDTEVEYYKMLLDTCLS
jgi:hypothetical protein